MLICLPAALLPAYAPAYFPACAPQTASLPACLFGCPPAFLSACLDACFSPGHFSPVDSPPCLCLRASILFLRIDTSWDPDDISDFRSKGFRSFGNDCGCHLRNKMAGRGCQMQASKNAGNRRTEKDRFGFGM